MPVQPAPTSNTSTGGARIIDGKGEGPLMEATAKLRVGLFMQPLDRHDVDYGDRTVYVSIGGRLTRVEHPGLIDGVVDRYGVERDDVKRLTGELLTLVDATFTDPIQRKAFKDKVKKELREWFTRIRDDAHYDAWPDDPPIGSIPVITDEHD